MNRYKYPYCITRAKYPDEEVMCIGTYAIMTHAPIAINVGAMQMFVSVSEAQAIMRALGDAIKSLPVEKAAWPPRKPTPESIAHTTN